MGKDRPRGIIRSLDSSFKVIPFLQESPYYSRMGAYYFNKNKLSKSLLFLQKAIEIEPGNPLNHYNLACLLSKAGRLGEANNIFKHIVQNMDRNFSECYYCLAINYGSMGETLEEKAWLLKYLQLCPEGEMADEAEEILLDMEEEELQLQDRYLDALENEAMMSLVEEINNVRFKEKLFDDQRFMYTLKRGLYQGGDILKEAIISCMGSVNSDSSWALLSDFVANPWVNERLRQVALLEMKGSRPELACRVFVEGSLQEITLKRHRPPAPVWKKEWQEVLECTYSNMRRSSSYGEEFFTDAKAIWVDYINRTYPHLPGIKKMQTWAAGLEYCLSRFHYLGLTQKGLAGAYRVSLSSIGRKFNHMNEVLSIDQKAYRNMLRLLAESEAGRL